jgi:hypothetical protein
MFAWVYGMMLGAVGIGGALMLSAERFTFL